jgi:hypothetical protein
MPYQMHNWHIPRPTLLPPCRNIALQMCVSHASVWLSLWLLRLFALRSRARACLVRVPLCNAWHSCSCCVLQMCHGWKDGLWEDTCGKLLVERDVCIRTASAAAASCPAPPPPRSSGGGARGTGAGPFGGAMTCCDGATSWVPDTLLWPGDGAGTARECTVRLEPLAACVAAPAGGMLLVAAGLEAGRATGPRGSACTTPASQHGVFDLPGCHSHSVFQGRSGHC